MSLSPSRLKTGERPLGGQARKAPWGPTLTERRGSVPSLLIVTLAVAAWLGFSLGLRRLALPDEGRYAGVAWEMLRSGDWMVPTLNGLPFFHKPPLYYWITGASLSVFGPHAWAARVAPWLGALLGALSLWLLLRRWSEPKTARWALVILVTQPLFFAGAQFANLDMLVAGFITATIALLADAVMRFETAQQGHRVSLVAAYAMAALGVLAKGLIGVLLPAGIVVVWLVLARRARWLRGLWSLPGTLVFIAIAAPWFVAMQQRYDDFAHYFFVYQHFHRYALSGFNNPQPVWFFVAGLALCTLPWFPALWAAWRTRAADRDPPSRLLLVLMWVWLLGIVVFFSMPSSKLIGYVLPAAPPLAALIADGVWRLSREHARTERRLKLMAALAVIVCVVGIVTVRIRDTRTTEPLAQVLAAQRTPGDAVIFVGAFFYDLPLHARLTEPVRVVEAWNAFDIAARDNWRKELHDAARFAPAQADAVLIDRADLAQLLCEHPLSWVFAPRGAAARYPLLGATAPIAVTERATLWRFDDHACVSHGRTPIAGLRGK